MEDNSALRTAQQILDDMGCSKLPSSRRPLKTVRQLLIEMGFSEKVPMGSELSKKIGNHVKLVICKKKSRLAKLTRDSCDLFRVIPYEEEHWNVIKEIVRVTVAEEYMSTETKPGSRFTVDKSRIFGTDAKKLVINDNNVTTKYLFPLLSSELPLAGRLKQSFKCDEERRDYQQRIVDLMNAVWMPEEAGDLINLNEKPYIWCRHKEGEIDKVIADLTDRIRFKNTGKYGGETLESLVVECGQELHDSWRDSIHYKLEKLLGYKIYKRVLQKSTGAPWVPGKWPPIVLDKEEAQQMRELLKERMLENEYFLDELANFLDSDMHSMFGDTDQRSAKCARIK